MEQEEFDKDLIVEEKKTTNKLLQRILLKKKNDQNDTYQWIQLSGSTAEIFFSEVKSKNPVTGEDVVDSNK